MLKRLYLYHSNDLHSHFQQWPKIISYFQNVRSRHFKYQESAFFFDIGDHMDRANPITEATHGKANIELMNRAGYHDVTIGNNEGITLPHQSLNSLYEKATFNVLVANLFDHDGNRPHWLKPYSIYSLDNGLKVGVIGVTVAFQTFYDLLGWEVKDPLMILPEVVKEVRQHADVVILLSHLGINDDERVAEEIEGIDVILGGHTHHLFKHGAFRKGTLLAAAGKYGNYIGEVILTIDIDKKEVINKEAYVVSMESIQECKETTNQLVQLEAASREILQEEIVTLKEDLNLSWFEPSPVTDLLSEALKEWCDTEIAMVNAGVILEPLLKGKVTRADLHRICPHPINPCKVVLKGDELKEVILYAFTEKIQKLKFKGFGFRGEVMGRMIFSGIEVKTEKLADGITHVQDIKVLGEPIDIHKHYSIATLDMFTFGNLFPELTQAKEKQYFLPEMLRDILLWKLKKCNV